MSSKKTTVIFDDLNQQSERTHPYWHWEKTNKNELPKRLKAWALIMGIEL